MIRRYTMEEASTQLRMKRRRLQDFLRDYPHDQNGEPYYTLDGRAKLFTDEDIRRLDNILPTTRNDTEDNRPGWVYFISASDFVKIGYTRSPVSRVIKMITHSPFELEILHFEPGTFKTEKILHRHFANIRVRGEWFQKTPELLAYIEQRRTITRGQE